MDNDREKQLINICNKIAQVLSEEKCSGGEIFIVLMTLYLETHNRMGSSLAHIKKSMKEALKQYEEWPKDSSKEPGKE
jgi:hypothetical protein